MLLRLLSSRGDLSGRTRHAFRWRGDGVSRIEGLSDTVFGFAITLVAVSLEVPRTAQELLHNSLGFVPFVASFLMLFTFWRAQFEFFRRYGLEDETTVWLTGLLLVSVLFLIYPLKFLLTVFIDAVIAGDVAKDRLRFEQFPSVLALYAVGLLAIFSAFALLYRHAHRQRDRLELNELEIFDTMRKWKAWTGAASVAGALLLWCGALVSIPAHLRARDSIFVAVYYGGLAVTILISLYQTLTRKRFNRQRDELLARVSAESLTGSPVAMD